MNKEQTTAHWLARDLAAYVGVTLAAGMLQQRAAMARDRYELAKFYPRTPPYGIPAHEWRDYAEACYREARALMEIE